MVRRLAKVAAPFFLMGAVVLAGCAGPEISGTVSDSERRAVSPRDDASPQRQPKPQHVSAGPTAPGMNRVSMAYPTGDPKTSTVGIDKVVPREVRLDQPFAYELKVTNLTDQNLHSVEVSDAVSSNMKIVGSSPQGKVDEENYVRWSLGSLGPNESKTIRVRAVATAQDVVTSCASVSYNALLCASIPVVEPQLRITKTGPAEVLLCDGVVYRFSVTNSGTGSIQNVRINDPLPDGMTTKNGSRSVTFDVGTLTPGQSRQYTSQVTASRTGRFVNKATASGDGDVSAASAEVATVVRQPVLKITKTGPADRFIGQTVTHEITVANTGDGAARDTVVQDTLSSGATLVSASDGGRLVGGKVTWDLGTLEPKASKKVTLGIRADVAGVIHNSAEARAYCASPVTAAAQTQFKGIPAILLEVVDQKDPIEVGQDVTYVITTTNQGTAPGTNITIRCNLEHNMQYVSSSGATRGSARDGTVTFEPVTSLPPGREASWRVVVKATEPGDVRFKVSMNSDQLGRPVEETEATNLYSQ